MSPKSKKRPNPTNGDSAAKRTRFASIDTFEEISQRDCEDSHRKSTSSTTTKNATPKKKSTKENFAAYHLDGAIISRMFPLQSDTTQQLIITSEISKSLTLPGPVRGKPEKFQPTARSPTQLNIGLLLEDVEIRKSLHTTSSKAGELAFVKFYLKKNGEEDVFFTDESGQRVRTDMIWFYDEYAGKSPDWFKDRLRPEYDEETRRIAMLDEIIVKEWEMKQLDWENAMIETLQNEMGSLASIPSMATRKVETAEKVARWVQQIIDAELSSADRAALIHALELKINSFGKGRGDLLASTRREKAASEARASKVANEFLSRARSAPVDVTLEERQTNTSNNEEHIRGSEEMEGYYW